MQTYHFETPYQWRKWLADNHDEVKVLWMVFYKKGNTMRSLSYESAVEEALCWGWVDSLIKKIDEDSYCRKFTPRRDNSKWSALNKQRMG